jgi:hypothetical protein
VSVGETYWKILLTSILKGNAVESRALFLLFGATDDTLLAMLFNVWNRYPPACYSPIRRQP